jgi:REP element-mobilizing transposase RayT
MKDKKFATPIVPDRIVDPRSQPHATPKWRGNLPHLYKEGCTYFATFSLIDTVPKHLQRKRLFEANDDAELIAAALDHETMAGSCLLKDPKLALIVENALLHFQDERYALSAWCVMPNHVHVVVTPFSGFTLPQILHSWKSFSAHEINKALGREGKVWEEEAFDHLVRTELAFEKFVGYTEDNPVVAGLCERSEDWSFGSARFRESRD